MPSSVYAIGNEIRIREMNHLTDVSKSSLDSITVLYGGELIEAKDGSNLYDRARLRNLNLPYARRRGNQIIVGNGSFGMQTYTEGNTGTGPILLHLHLMHKVEYNKEVALAQLKLFRPNDSVPMPSFFDYLKENSVEFEKITTDYDTNDITNYSKMLDQIRHDRGGSKSDWEKLADVEDKKPMVAAFYRALSRVEESKKGDVITKVS